MCFHLVLTLLYMTVCGDNHAQLNSSVPAAKYAASVVVNRIAETNKPIIIGAHKPLPGIVGA